MYSWWSRTDTYTNMSNKCNGGHPHSSLQSLYNLEIILKMVTIPTNKLCIYLIIIIICITYVFDTCRGVTPMHPVHNTLQRGSYSLLSLYNFDIILYLEKSTATLYMYLWDTLAYPQGDIDPHTSYCTIWRISW